jgi:hypothetical protein
MICVAQDRELLMQKENPGSAVTGVSSLCQLNQQGCRLRCGTLI